MINSLTISLIVVIKVSCNGWGALDPLGGADEVWQSFISRVYLLKFNLVPPRIKQNDQIFPIEICALLKNDRLLFKLVDKSD